jgi:hypothetical protein
VVVGDCDALENSTFRHHELVTVTLSFEVAFHDRFIDSSELSQGRV